MLQLLLKKLETARAAWFFGVSYLLSQIVLIMILSPLGISTFLRLQVSFSKYFYLQTFQAWQAQGVFDFYPRHLYVDALHPVWYTLFLISLMAILTKNDPRAERHQTIFLLPILAGLADVVENLIQWIFVSHPARLNQMLVVISSFASVVKWSSAFLSLVMIAWLGASRFWSAQNRL